MKLDEFNTLSDEEKSAYLAGVETAQQSINDLTAERDSFKTENNQIKAQLEANNKELKATKEMNFTLARKIDTKPAESPEDILHNIIKEFR